jgi:hypothetical protein
LHTSTFKTVPNYLYAYNVKVMGCSLPRIAERLKTEGDASVSNSNIDELANSALIRGSLNLSDNPRPLQLPAAMSVGGNLSASSNMVITFGADTVILGTLNVGPTQDGSEFALDFIGRLIKTGDSIKLAKIPEIVFEGTKLALRGSGADATFLGRHRDGGYSCRVADEAGAGHRIVSPRREEILADTDQKPSKKAGIAPPQGERGILLH